MNAALARIEGIYAFRSDLTVPKGELGDIRRQIAFEEHMGKGLRNTTGHRALKRHHRDVTRCVRVTSLSQRDPPRRINLDFQLA